MRFIQAEHYYTTNSPRWIVIHDMEYPKQAGAAEWCARYFAGPNAPQKSAHYCIDPVEIIQSVHENNGAWHTQGFIHTNEGALEINRYSIGIEHAGYASQDRAQWLDPGGTRELEQSAQLVSEIAQRHGIPVRYLSVDEIRRGEPGIAGHVDFNRATGAGDHTDPGPSFPWDWYMARVREASKVSTETSESHVLRNVLVLAALGVGVWAYTQPAAAQRLLRRIGLS